MKNLKGLLMIMFLVGLVALLPQETRAEDSSDSPIMESDSGNDDESCTCDKAGQCVDRGEGVCGKWETSPGYLGGCCRLAPSFCCSGSGSASSDVIEIDEDDPRFKVINKYILHELRLEQNKSKTNKAPAARKK